MDLLQVFMAAGEVQSFLEAQKWPFCIIGGLAIQRWGAPRFTTDVDLTLLTGFGEEEVYVDRLFEFLTPRNPNAREFALLKRVVLAKTPSGIAVDIALGAFPFEENSIKRSSIWESSPGPKIRTCSAEDLVIHKVFAGRDHAWGDVENILIRQKGKLDFKLIRSELQPLLDLKHETESFVRLDRMIDRVNRSLERKI
jgi:hypothetical protein